MSIEKLLNQLKQLTTLHEKLLTISEKKTDCIKSGDMDELAKLLTVERKEVQKIEQLEKEREREVERIFSELHITSKEKTVNELLANLTNEQEKSSLEEAVTYLLNVIVNLRQNEQLNSELIQQSMQFVQMSLDLLQPSLRGMNYTEKTEKSERINRSIFDSRA